MVNRSCYRLKCADKFLNIEVFNGLCKILLYNRVCNIFGKIKMPIKVEQDQKTFRLIQQTFSRA